MALKFRRGTTAQQSGSLAFGEPYVNTSLGTLVVGGQSGDIVLSTSGTGSTGNFGAISGSGLDITGNANIAGNLTLGGAITIGDATADTVNVVASLSSSLIPSVNDAFDLGSATKIWRDLYISTGSIKMYDGAGNLISTLSATADGMKISGELSASTVNGLGSPSAFSSSVVSKFNTLGSYTGSVDTRLTEIGVVSGSLISSASAASISITNLNTTSASLNTSVSNLNSFTSSINTTIKSKLDADGIVSGSSQITLSSTTGFSAYSTSVDSRITTEKGRVDAILLAADADKDSFAEIVTLINSVDTTNDNAFASFYTASVGRLNNLESTSASVNTSVSNINTTTASLNTSVSNLNSTTASLNTSVSNLNSFTSSINTTIKSKLDADGVISSSAQLTTTFDSRYLNTGGDGVVSGSAQIDVASTTGDIALGTRTSGNYVATITAGTGVSSTGATTGEGIAHTISIGQAVATSDNVRFNSIGVGMAASATAGRIDAANDVVAFSTSDIRFKENITPIPNAIEKIRKISGNTYDWKAELKDVHGYEGNDVGVIAQEVEEVLPQLVQNRDNGYKAVKYDKLVALLIEGIKEQQQHIDNLTIQVEELKKQKGL